MRENKHTNGNYWNGVTKAILFAFIEVVLSYDYYYMHELAYNYQVDKSRVQMNFSVLDFLFSVFRPLADEEIAERTLKKEE